MTRHINFLRIYHRVPNNGIFTNCRERLALAIKRGGLYEISEDLDMKASLDNLTHKDEALALGRGRLDKSLESFNLTGEIV